MGCCVNYLLGTEHTEALDALLIALKGQADRFGFSVTRVSIQEDKKELFVQPHEKCETLILEFKQLKDWDGSEFWGENIVRRFREHQDEAKKSICNISMFDPFIGNGNLWLCSGFVKTEYAPESVHARVCEFLRLCASVCTFVCIHDEAGFYGTRSAQNLHQGHGYLAGKKVKDLQVNDEP